MLCLRQFFIDEGTCPHLHDEEHAGGLGLSKVRVIRIVWDQRKIYLNILCTDWRRAR